MQVGAGAAAVADLGVESAQGPGTAGGAGGAGSGGAAGGTGATQANGVSAGDGAAGAAAGDGGAGGRRRLQYILRQHICFSPVAEASREAPEVTVVLETAPEAEAEAESGGAGLALSGNATYSVACCAVKSGLPVPAVLADRAQPGSAVRAVTVIRAFSPPAGTVNVETGSLLSGGAGGAGGVGGAGNGANGARGPVFPVLISRSLNQRDDPGRTEW